MFLKVPIGPCYHRETEGERGKRKKKTQSKDKQTFVSSKKMIKIFRLLTALSAVYYN